MSEFSVSGLLQTGTITVKDVLCRGLCRHRSAEECSAATHFVFPYRGLYLRHVGNDESVADANHLLLFNAGEGYQVSHPVSGGDKSLVLALPPELLCELAPRSLLQKRGEPRFHMQSLRIGARAQAQIAMLRHRLGNRDIGNLEAETLALSSIRLSVGPGTTRTARSRQTTRRLVARIKILLASDLHRKWQLSEIAAQVGGSAVYLTQVFQKLEGLPLYRYQLQLRLARALDLIGRCEDLSVLALDLGFSSHSHFSTAFKQAYGQTPSTFRACASTKRALPNC